MSTRSIIVFKDAHSENYIYVHWNGYPSCRLVELQDFLKWNKPRNHDMAYATANFVFWYKLRSIRDENVYADDSEKITAVEAMLTPSEEDIDLHRGIGVVDKRWDDQDFKYVVDFDKKTIHITGYETDATVNFGQVVKFDGDYMIQEETPIPA